MIMDKTGIICIFYNPSQDCIQFWNKMLIEGYETIIIDNTPSSNELKLSSGIHYKALNKNYGIAFAQNIGIKRANELGCTHIIFFDQDSRPERKLIGALKGEFIKIQKKGIRIGAIGPKVVNLSTGDLYKGREITDSQPYVTKSIISSGEFTSMDVLNDVGGLLEVLFIDYVDKEWCWRAISKGYKIYVSPDCFLKHMVGLRATTILSISFIISAPRRYFYQYRNFIWLLGRAYVPCNWKLKTMIRRLFEIVLVPLICKEKWITFKFINKGIWAGIKGFGKFNS